MAAKSGSGHAASISHSGADTEEAMIHSSVNYIYVTNEVEAASRGFCFFTEWLFTNEEQVIRTQTTAFLFAVLFFLNLF